MIAPGSCCAQGTGPHSSTSKRWVHCCCCQLTGSWAVTRTENATGLGRNTALSKTTARKKWLWDCRLSTNILSPRVLLGQTMLSFLCKFIAAALYFNWKASTLFLIILLVKLAENFRSGCCSIDSLFSWCLPVPFPIIPYVTVSKSLTNLNVYPVLEHGIVFLFQLCRTEVFPCN